LRRNAVAKGGSLVVSAKNKVQAAAGGCALPKAKDPLTVSVPQLPPSSVGETVALVPDCMKLYTPVSGKWSVIAVAAAFGSDTVFNASLGRGFTIQ